MRLFPLASHPIRCLLFTAFAAACSTGCAAGDDGITASSTSGLFGGAPMEATSLEGIGVLASYDDTGSLVQQQRRRRQYDRAFCTATLIGPKLVLTAKHCLVGQEGKPFAFLTGYDNGAFATATPAVSFDIERTVRGGVVGGGSDIAVVQLASRPAGVQPLALGVLDERDLGTRFAVVGYGRRGLWSLSQERRIGTVTFRATTGNVWDHVYASYEDYVAALTYGSGELTDEQRRILRARFDGLFLLDGYEVVMGGGPGDSFASHGDSGGPVLRVQNGVATVFGVTSWSAKDKAGLPVTPGVTAVFGPAALAMIGRALVATGATAARRELPAAAAPLPFDDTRLAPRAPRAVAATAPDEAERCAAARALPRCEGDALVRCTAPFEGRTTRTVTVDCTLAGLACRRQGTDSAACAMGSAR